MRVAALLVFIAAPVAAQDLVTPGRVGRADAPLTLTVWAQQDYSHLAARPAIANVFTSVFDDWARAHQGVQLRVSVMPALELHKAKLQLAAAAGRLPDVASIDSFWLPLLAGEVQPLDDFWPADDRRDFLPFTIQTLSDPAGHVLGLWHETDCRVLFYRKDLVPVAPRRWDELLDAASRVSREHHISGYLYNGGRWEGTVFDHLAMFWAQGGELVDGDGRPIFGEGANRRAMLRLLAFLRDTVQRGASPRSVLGHNDYVAAVRAAVESSGPELETVVGELRRGTDYANLLPGVLSARVYLKQQNAHVQTLLESYAEPLSVFASLATPAPHASEREPVNPIGGEPFPGPPTRAAILEREPSNPVEREPSNPVEREPSNPVEREPFRRADPFRYPAGELRYAWKTLLQNHPHDSICGCSIDAVHEENMTRFARAGQVASALVHSALDAIADSVPAPPGDTVRVVVVNPDASERAQVVEAFIDLPIDSAEPWRHVDPQALDRPVTFWPRDATITGVAGPDGAPVAFQILGEEAVVHHEMSRYETPWALNVRRLHIAWWAPALPGCGYAAFDLQIGDAKTASEVVQTFRSARSAGSAASAGLKAGTTDDVLHTDDVRAENEHLALSVNADGTFEVRDKHTGTTYRRVAAIEDAGDIGDEYNYCPPAADRVVTNAEARVIGVSVVASGAVRTTVRVELEFPLPAAASADRKSRESGAVAMPVTIDATIDVGSPRVAFDVTIDNRAKDHRLRMLFPTGAANVAIARADTAFDVVSRPARQPVPAAIRNEAPVSSAPMTSFVSGGDTRAGATVIGKGLMEYEIVGDEPAIALTLIRAVGDLSRTDLATRPSGQAGPPVATPAAQCLGRHRFEMAFEPHGAPPRAGALFASARAHNIPPRVVFARARDGKAPLERAFLGIDHRAGDVVLSAIKQAEERPTTIVRLFNPGDEPADVVVSLEGLAQSERTTRRDFEGPALSERAVRRESKGQAYTVNFLEERQTELQVVAGAVALRLRPRRIQTIELVT